MLASIVKTILILFWHTEAHLMVWRKKFHTFRNTALPFAALPWSAILSIKRAKLLNTLEKFSLKPLPAAILKSADGPGEEPKRAALNARDWYCDDNLLSKWLHMQIQNGERRRRWISLVEPVWKNLVRITPLDILKIYAYLYFSMVHLTINWQSSVNRSYVEVYGHFNHSMPVVFYNLALPFNSR